MTDRLTDADLDRLEAAVTDSHLREDNGVPSGGAMVMPAREVGALLAEVRAAREREGDRTEDQTP